MEGMEEAQIKEKKPRTPAQVEAFKRAQDIRNDNAKIKKEHADAIKTEKVLQLIEKQKKTKEIQEKYHRIKAKNHKARKKQNLNQNINPKQNQKRRKLYMNHLPKKRRK